MNVSLRLCVGSLLIGALTLSAQAEPEDPAQIAFDEKFGKEMRQVRVTRETDDDIELAQRLVREADSGEHAEGLTVLLYEQAYEIGLRDLKGYRLSSGALDKLLKKDPERHFEVGDMRLTLWEKWHEADPDSREIDTEEYIDLSLRLSNDAAEAGDTKLALKFLNRGNRFASRVDSPRKNDVRDSITELMRTNKAMEEIAELKEQLGKDPEAADKLVMIYLAQLDQPSEAALYAHQMSDFELSAKVLLVSTGFDFATTEGAYEAGTFYLDLINQGDTREPVAMLIRARVWLSEHLSRNLDDQDPDAVAMAKSAKKMLGEIDEQLLKRGIGKKLRRKMSSLIRGGKGQFDRPPAVQAAIDKAVEWLYEQRKEETQWEQDHEKHRNWGGYTSLVVYAMLMADEDPRINGDLSRAVHFMMNAELQGTYAICFRIHAWEVLPRRERYRQTLTKDVLRLRKGAKEGFWGYTMAGNDVQPGTKVDISTTMAGALGLWIGEVVGGVTPQNVYWERTARGLIETQLPDKGWSYNPYVTPNGQGAMTAGAIALLHAGYPHLNEDTKVKAKDAIAKGMEWMDENFSEKTNVNRGGRFNTYYFAAVQHAGLFSGRRDFKNMDWYDSITAHLLEQQAANGAWGDVAETAFAVAFLCRGGVAYEGTDNVIEEVDNAAAEEAEEQAASTQAPAEDSAAAPDASPVAE